MHPPGIEPGAPAWKANMLPLHHGCCKCVATRNRTWVFSATTKCTNHYTITTLKVGLLRELNPRPLAPKARIIPLDQEAFTLFIKSADCRI